MARCFLALPSVRGGEDQARKAAGTWRSLRGEVGPRYAPTTPETQAEQVRQVWQVSVAFLNCIAQSLVSCCLFSTVAEHAHAMLLFYEVQVQ